MTRTILGYIALVLGIGVVIGLAVTFEYLPDDEDIYTGTLIDVEYTLSKGWGCAEAWFLTFEDGQIYTTYRQPESGFQLGKKYVIYKKDSKYIRARLK